MKAQACITVLKANSCSMNKIIVLLILAAGMAAFLGVWISITYHESLGPLTPLPAVIGVLLMLYLGHKTKSIK